jgi:hypothetical protein
VGGLSDGEAEGFAVGELKSLALKMVKARGLPLSRSVKSDF